MNLCGRIEISEDGVLTLEPPEEEPLDDLAQPLPGFQCREKADAGAWRQDVQYASRTARSHSIAMALGGAGTQAQRIADPG
jgi:hypothetical protein